MYYDVRSALGGLIAENVSVETVFAIVKGYESINPNMVRKLKLDEHQTVMLANEEYEPMSGTDVKK